MNSYGNYIFINNYSYNQAIYIYIILSKKHKHNILLKTKRKIFTLHIAFRMNTEPVSTSTLTTTHARIPIMSWSQTPTTVTLIVAVRAPQDCEHSIQWFAERIHFESTVHDKDYKVDAEWFSKINTEKCTWKSLGNGDVLLQVTKDTEEEWSFPCADRAKYKGFVKIDWSRWQDVASDDDTSDDGDVGPLSYVTPIDFGGNDVESFPKEDNSKFQDMLKGLERLGGESNTDLPKLDDMKKNMTEEDIHDFLQTYNNEDGEVNLDKITGKEPLIDENSTVQSSIETNE